MTLQRGEVAVHSAIRQSTLDWTLVGTAESAMSGSATLEMLQATVSCRGTHTILTLITYHMHIKLITWLSLSQVQRSTNESVCVYAYVCVLTFLHHCKMSLG